MNGSGFQWILCSGGYTPPNAFIAGTTLEGEPLYIGRASHGGTITPGKVHRTHGCLYIPFDGAEVAIQEYEVLCTA